MAQNGTSRAKKQPRRPQNGRRRSLLFRILIGLLVVLVVGGLSFLIGYLIGLQLGVVALF